MTKQFAARPSYRTKFAQSRTVAYMFLPATEPICNSRCTDCYVLCSESLRSAVKRSEDKILEDLQSLVAQGYAVIPITTEVLLMRRYLDILRAVNANYVNTNGRVLVARPEVLGELKSIGISQVVVTANFGNSGLCLTQTSIVDEAVGLVRNAGLSLMLRVRVTKKNLESVLEMVSACIARGASTIEFLREIPINSKTTEILNEAETKRFFEILKEVRSRYPYSKSNGEGVYITAGGTFGTQFKPDREVMCGAGTSRITIGLDNRVYPCIYITTEDAAIGRFEDGRIIIDRKFELGGNEFDCPAYRYWKEKNKGGRLK